MGTNISKNDNDYIKIVDTIDSFINGFITLEEYQQFLNTHSILIKDNFYKIIIKNPGLVIKLIKIYPQVRKSLLNILGREEFRFLSHEFEVNNL